ncbi:hypothetical protein RRG08_031660 [Elysia crispata]|uniref:DNA-directed RNA polymerase I subunit RPA49 n=1 Tax=Elysia crispata TaxID=231223 RepID=A0AAE1DA39_9GAST|nr:hypothetical protein RRG08_031660 [Elysia crispata]
MSRFEVDTDGSPITLVRYSNGTTNNKLAVKSYSKEDYGQDGTFQQQILTSCVDGISYVGSNFGIKNRFPTDSCKYYMGIHDKSIGKIRVVPASLIQLEPWFQEKEEDSLAFTATTFKEKRDALQTEFGSGRSQRAVNKRLREKLDEDMVASTAETAINSSNVNHKEIAETSASPSTELKTQSEAIPPYNINAKTPDEVYLLKDIVSNEVLTCLIDVSSALTCSTKEDLAMWRKNKTYFSYILDKVEALSEIPQARLLQGQCLMYLQYLMTFYLMKSMELRGKYPLPSEWPGTVRYYLLDKFTLEVKEPGQRFRRCVPSRMKDLVLSHILVLCLKMNEFSLDISHLMTDLKLSAKKLTTHASFLGCSSKKSKPDGYTVTLKVPLTFPVLKDKQSKNKIF